jgi:hypothetical protein
LESFEREILGGILNPIPFAFLRPTCDIPNEYAKRTAVAVPRIFSRARSRENALFTRAAMFGGKLTNFRVYLFPSFFGFGSRFSRPIAFSMKKHIRWMPAIVRVNNRSADALCEELNSS